MIESSSKYVLVMPVLCVLLDQHVNMCINITMCIILPYFSCMITFFYILVIFARILPTFIIFNKHVLYLFIFFIPC